MEHLVASDFQDHVGFEERESPTIAAHKVRSIVKTFGVEDPTASCHLRPGGDLVIRDGQRRVATVQTRLGVYLPGGDVEPGETSEQAAIREVRDVSPRDT